MKYFILFILFVSLATCSQVEDGLNMSDETVFFNIDQKLEPCYFPEQLPGMKINISQEIQQNHSEYLTYWMSNFIVHAEASNLAYDKQEILETFGQSHSG